MNIKKLRKVIEDAGFETIFVDEIEGDYEIEDDNGNIIVPSENAIVLNNRLYDVIEKTVDTVKEPNKIAEKCNEILAMLPSAETLFPVEIEKLIDQTPVNYPAEHRHIYYCLRNINSKLGKVIDAVNELRKK